jgi:flagellar basal-body rod protein FlgB
MVEKIDNNTYLLIKKALDASSERTRTIAHNVANINTSGFKASRVVFEDKLGEVLRGEAVGLKTTNSKHISEGSDLSTLTHEVKKDKSTSMRLDGNNVDIDSEMTNLAANSILYNALTNQANSRISMRRYVTNEGRR